MRIVNGNPLIGELIAELEKSLELAATLPPHIFCAAEDGAGSIGAHIRHTLDFVNGLLRGLKIGSVDYASRERDGCIETDQDYAAKRIESAIESLRECVKIDSASLLNVRSEVRPDIRHRSSFSRELEFVYSHAVHHHALINERLNKHGIVPGREFGVAPSTSRYWNSLRMAA